MAKGLVFGGLNGSSGSVIKSIQRGVAQITTGTTLNVSISSVDVNKSIVIIETYSSGSNNNPGRAQYTGYLTTATNLRLDVGTNGVGHPEIAWTVIEFASVKSLQKGSFTLANAGSEQDITVTAVDLQKAALFYSMRKDSIDSADMIVRGRIKNSTTISFLQGYSGAIIQWYLVEFN